MTRYSIQAPDYNRSKMRAPSAASHQQTGATPKPTRPKFLSEADKAALVDKYFVPLTDIMEKWQLRLSKMGLTRLHLALMCRKLSQDDEKIVTAAEIHDWFFLKSGMGGDLWKIERQKANVFDALLDRVEEAIKAGEVFKIETQLRNPLPRKGARIFYASQKGERVFQEPASIFFTPDMRQTLKKAFEICGVKLIDIHHHMTCSQGGAENMAALNTVYRWFNQEAGVIHIRKPLLATFLHAAVSLMEEKNGIPAAVVHSEPEVVQLAP